MKEGEGKNAKNTKEVNTFLSNLTKKYILTEGEVNNLFEKRSEEIVLPVSIFNNKTGMLESASLYLKDELNLSFKDIAKLLKRDYKTIWTSYTKAKKKTKNAE